MSKFHNTREAEHLALYAHNLAAGVSFVAGFIAIAGFFWHLKAAQEHKQHLKELPR